jgi:inosose dehydratase
MPVRLGVSPIGWSNDDLPELGGEMPVETCLAEARHAGFAGIELGNKFPRDPAALWPLLNSQRLALISGWFSGRILERPLADEFTAIEDHCTLLVAMGCRVLVYAETSGGVAGDRRQPLSRRPRLRDDEWRDFGARLTGLADGLARRRIGFSYHPHMGTVVETEAEIDQLMAATGDRVGLLFDTGHLAFAGADPAAVARRHARRINHVHCKDIRPHVLPRVRARDASFLDAVLDGVFTVPGDGAIDFAATLAPLSTARYRGWLVVEAEQDPAKAPPFEYARLGFSNLSAAAAVAGFAVEA